MSKEKLFLYNEKGKVRYKFDIQAPKRIKSVQEKEEKFTDSKLHHSSKLQK